uniref:Uncharacterized protein n=1 Tax=Arundo donax TaxID=35708 RepID=A0A0A8YW02_ARUDO
MFVYCGCGASHIMKPALSNQAEYDLHKIVVC